MVIIVQDSFNRPDRNTGLGNADSGQTWVNLSGTWGITNNQAYWISGNPGISIIESGKSDVSVSLVSILSSPSQLSGSVCFRLSDGNNYWLYRFLSNELQLYKFVGGSASLVASKFYGTLNTGNHTFKVKVNGSLIECYLNDVIQLTVTDNHNANQTKHGVRLHATTAARFDDFLVESLGVTEPTGEDVTQTYAMSQRLYKDAAINSATKQLLYANHTANQSALQRIYKDASTAFNLKNVLYADRSINYAMLQEFFNEGIQRSTNFAMNISIYRDRQQTHAMRQELYHAIQDHAELTQVMYADQRFDGALRQEIHRELAQNVAMLQRMYDDKQTDYPLLVKILADYRVYNQIIEREMFITREVDKEMTITTVFTKEMRI